jgi:hypothetical protein
MKNSDFPNYFQAADNASIKAQEDYLNLNMYNLFSMIIAAALTLYNMQAIEPKMWLYIVSGLLLFISMGITILLKVKKYEDIWYQSRALAESCKTLTWRYVTCSELFEISLSAENAKNIFVERIRSIVDEFKDLTSKLKSKTLNLPIVTSKMKEVRALSTNERKNLFIEKRINDQKDWYSTKAEFNQKKHNLWFWVIIVFQFLSIVAIVYLIKIPDSNWNFIGLFTTISASALSWLQLKRHQELKEAYTTATQELNFIVELSENVETDMELSKFVLDSENAISREHTLWVAQRR